MLKGAKLIAKELEAHAKPGSCALTIAKQIDYLGGVPTAEPEPVRISDSPKDLLEFDLENENETIRNYRVRVQQCEAIGEYAIAEEIREILRVEQEHQIDLATALGRDVPNLVRDSAPAGRKGR